MDKPNQNKPIVKKLHFAEAELAGRRGRVLAGLRARGLDGLLIFRQESSYYLTGFDTYGFIFFTCVLLEADGRTTVLTRAPDLLQAQTTSVIDEIRIWVDREGANPAEDLKTLLRERGYAGKRLGIELEANGLNGLNERRVSAALEGFCALEDASDLVSRLRMVKSEAELQYVRKAAGIADQVMDEVNRLAVPGAFEGKIVGAAMNTVLQNDGDFPAHDYIISSGPHAFLGRYHSGRRTLEQNDQLFFEFGVPYRHYHANLLRVVLQGKPKPRHLEMHKVAVEAIHAIEDALRPGRPIGEAFDAFAGVVDRAGYASARGNACGYSLGATFIPNWMDWPMLYHGNTIEAEPNMVFFPIAFLGDGENDVAMGVARTVAITGKGCEALSAIPFDLVINA